MDKEFKKKNYFEKRAMPIDELARYYAELRKHEYNQGKELSGIELRQKFGFLVSGALKADQLFSKEKIVVIKDERTQNSKNNKIYACTHIGGNDIQRARQLSKPSYLMLSNPGEALRKPVHILLDINGVIIIDSEDMEDRNNAYNRSIELLQKNGNLIIFPEAAWNVSPNVNVMKLFQGTVKMAIETGAEIIPMACEQYENTFYFNIGKEYTISKTDSRDIEDLTDDLREKLATLKSEIIKRQPKLSRNTIPDNYLEVFQDEIISRCNYGYGFALENALREKFRDKTVTEPEEVFAFLENLDFTKYVKPKDKEFHEEIISRCNYVYGLLEEALKNKTITESEVSAFLEEIDFTEYVNPKEELLATGVDLNQVRLAKDKIEYVGRIPEATRLGKYLYNEEENRKKFDKFVRKR